MSTPDLPPDVVQIMDYIGQKREAYGILKWNEEAMLKADMMNVRHRWSSHRVPAAALRAKCQEVGLNAEETRDVVGWLDKTQAGRRLVPNRQYKDWRFKPEPTDD